MRIYAYIMANPIQATFYSQESNISNDINDNFWLIILYREFKHIENKLEITLIWGLGGSVG